MPDTKFKKATQLFQKLPGVGPRQAARFVLALLEKPESELQEMGMTLFNLKQEISLCKECFNLSEEARCNLCQSASRREKNKICVVEKVLDLQAIERTGLFKGVYHVLRSPALADARFGENHPAVMALIDRIQRLGGETEIILGLSATTEGRATALFIESVLKANKTKITRLGRGLSSGIEIEYADRDTLVDAFRNRK